METRTVYRFVSGQFHMPHEHTDEKQAIEALRAEARRMGCPHLLMKQVRQERGPFSWRDVDVRTVYVSA
jgi:hypothetical protein